MSKPGLVLDVYGTLLMPLSYEPVTERALAALTGISEERATEILRPPYPDLEIGRPPREEWLRSVLEAAGSDAHPSDLMRSLRTVFASAHVLPEATRQVLQLRVSEKRTCIVSTTTHIGASAARGFGLQAGVLVDSAVYSCEAGIKKPDPAIYRLASSHLKRPRSRCVMIDDTLMCVVGAIAFGMAESILMLHSGGSFAGRLGTENPRLLRQLTEHPIMNVELGVLSQDPADTLGLDLATRITVARQFDTAVHFAEA